MRPTGRIRTCNLSIRSGSIPNLHTSTLCSCPPENRVKPAYQRGDCVCHFATEEFYLPRQDSNPQARRRSLVLLKYPISSHLAVLLRFWHWNPWLGQGVGPSPVARFKFPYWQPPLCAARPSASGIKVSNLAMSCSRSRRPTPSPIPVAHRLPHARRNMRVFIRTPGPARLPSSYCVPDFAHVLCT